MSDTSSRVSNMLHKPFEQVMWWLNTYLRSKLSCQESLSLSWEYYGGHAQSIIWAVKSHNGWIWILCLFCIALRFPGSSKMESWDHLYNILLISYGIACRCTKMTSKRSHLSSWDQKPNVADCEYQGNWIGLRFRTHWKLGPILSFSSSLSHLNHGTHVVPGDKFTLW